jgi:hypothetical protein
VKEIHTNNYKDVVYRKIKFELMKIKESIKYMNQMYDEDLIFFEGGLGSQILAYFEYLYLIQEGRTPKVNFDYFTESKEFDDTNSLIQRPWALGYYGVEISSFDSINKSHTTLKSRIPTNLLPRSKPNYFKRYKNVNFRSHFPINEKIHKTFLNENQITGDYYAIHLRRGDFRFVASAMVTDNEVLSLVQKLFELSLKNPIIIFSDSELDYSWFVNLQKMGFSKILLADVSKVDQFLAHSLMRAAKILITSNSTFSLSAALLSRSDQLTVVPMRFYGGYRDEPMNKLINQLSTFSIVS